MNLQAIKKFHSLSACTDGSGWHRAILVADVLSPFLTELYFEMPVLPNELYFVCVANHHHQGLFNFMIPRSVCSGERLWASGRSLKGMKTLKKEKVLATIFSEAIFLSIVILPQNDFFFGGIYWSQTVCLFVHPSSLTNLTLWDWASVHLVSVVLHSVHVVCMGLGLGISVVKKLICGVALNKEQFDPTSSSPKKVSISICVQNTSICQSGY